MRTFKTRLFDRFAEKERISDAALLEAITAAEVKPDAILGAGLIKQRIARPNEGKSGGYRTIIVFRGGDRAVFVHGFAKNRRENISDAELRAFKDLASFYLGISVSELERMASAGGLKEVAANESFQAVQK